MESSFSILNYYILQKSKIPVNSSWYPNVYEHPSYFESEMTYRTLSKNTNTFIQPNVKQNIYWLEEKIIGYITKSLESIVNSGHTNVLGETILIGYPIIESLSKSLDVKNGTMILTKFSQNVKKLSNKKKIEQNILNYDDWKHELGCIDTYCHALFRFQIGIIIRITEFDSQKIKSEYDKIDWNKENTIYLTDFIPEQYELLNKFHTNVVNELYVEDKRITPDWYFKQKLISEYLRIISDKIVETIKIFNTHLLFIAKIFNGENNPLLSSFAAQLGLELLNKIRFQIEKLKVSIIDIDQFDVCKGEYQWTKPDFILIEKLLNEYDEECFSICSGNIEKLSLIKWDSQYPDIFAQTYSIISSQITYNFFNEDIEKIQKYFPPFLKAAINAFGNLNQIFKHYSRPEYISYQTLVDVMQISGYAYIYSVIYKNSDYWLKIKSAWDEFFFPTKENIDLMVTFYNFHKNSLFGTGINYIDESERENTLLRLIEKLKITPKDIDDSIVKPFIRDSYHIGDTAELFIEIYLFSFIEAKNATTLLRSRDVFENIIRNLKYPKSVEDDYEF